VVVVVIVVMVVVVFVFVMILVLMLLAGECKGDDSSRFCCNRRATATS